MWDVILIRDNALSIEMTATHSLRRQALIAFDRMHQSAAYIASVMLTAERQRAIQLAPQQFLERMPLP